jgi:V8-like Glu-specific endopeptidase
MARLFFGLLGFCFFCFLASADSPNLYQKYKPAVFKIRLLVGSAEIGHGTGFFVSSDGDAITNLHVLKYPVVDSSYSAEFDFADGTSSSNLSIYQCTNSTDADFCLIHIDHKAQVWFTPSPHEATTGTKVFTIGHPLDRDYVMSDGTVVSYEDRTGDIHTRLIDITNTVDHGNSGGPIFGEDGTLYGVTTYAIKGQKFKAIGVASSAIRDVQSARLSRKSLADFRSSMKSGIQKLALKWKAAEIDPVVKSLEAGANLNTIDSLKSNIVKLPELNFPLTISLPKRFNCSNDKTLFSCESKTEFTAAFAIMASKIPEGITSILQFNGKTSKDPEKPSPLLLELETEGKWNEIQKKLTPEQLKLFYSNTGKFKCDKIHFGGIADERAICSYEITNLEKPGAKDLVIMFLFKNHILYFLAKSNVAEFEPYTNYLPYIALLTAKFDNETVSISTCHGFPSMTGAWKGNYIYNSGPPVPQTVALSFSGGKISGQGKDQEIGSFTITGSYSDQTGEVSFIKKYKSSTVNYSGKLIGDTINGKWEIPPNGGGGTFSIGHKCDAT